jgi:hypothetical protein
LSRYRIQGIQILWGNHYRAGSILEISRVTSLEENDLVEIIVDQGIAPQATQMEVKYQVGSEDHITYVPRGTTIEQITQRLTFAHKGRAGFVYWMSENRQMEIYVLDAQTSRTKIKLAGNSSLEDLCEICRQKWNKPIWDDVTIARADGTPFWIEEKGECLAEIRYNPAKDTRKICTIKVVCSKENQVFVIENYRVSVEDPTAIWLELCSKYGFVNPGTHLKVEGNPDIGIVYTYKLPASVMNVKLPVFQSRTFTIIVDNDNVWETGEILSPAAWEREAIWNQLSEIRDLPHYSQFNFSYDHGEVPATAKRLPAGHNKVVRIKFPVKWHIELFEEEVIQSNMHLGLTVHYAWALLHTEIPRLYQFATFNYAGFLQPNATITAEVQREDVTLSVTF